METISSRGSPLLDSTTPIWPRLLFVECKFNVAGSWGVVKETQSNFTVMGTGPPDPLGWILRSLSTPSIEVYNGLTRMELTPFSRACFTKRRATPMSARSVRFAFVGLITAAGLVAFLVADEVRDMSTHNRWLQHDVRRPKPPVIEPVGSSAVPHTPKDAMILFDGTNLDAWRHPEGGPARWKVTEGFMEVAPGTGPIQSKGKFGDVQMHVEWASPKPPDGKGQDRGNSGIFLMGLYELQVLDSYRADTYADGQAGAIYGQYPPLGNASLPPGEWQTYDIAFRRPRFDKDGKLLEPARVTLIHNGILIQNNEELWGRTNWLESSPYEAHADRGAIQLQDHGHPVRFRNIWVRELPERRAPGAEDLARPQVISLSALALDQFAGQYAMGPEKDARPVTISRGDGYLLFKLPFRPTPLVLQAVSATDFVLPHTDARFTFQRDDQGRVTGLLFTVGDGERLLTKIKP
jgi:hypothetical protein